MENIENKNVTQFPRVRSCEQVKATTQELQQIVGQLLLEGDDPRPELDKAESEHRRGGCYVRFTSYFGVVLPSCLEDDCSDYIC